MSLSSESSSSHPMIVDAIRNIARQLPSLLLSLYTFILRIMTTIVIPVTSMIVVTIVSWKILREVFRIICPPSAATFHREALGLLKKGDDDPSTIRQAERLLKKSIKRHSTFLPSHLSLASLQLYEKKSPEECLETIEIALQLVPDDNNNNNDELLQLQLDAKAIEQNMGHMVTAGLVTVPYLGDVPYSH